MAHISGKSGAVYGLPLEIEDCEDAWDEGGEDAGSTPSTTTGKVGTNAARATTVSVGSSADLMHEARASVDLSAYAGVMFWFRSSLGSLSAGDLAFLLDDTAQCASPIETINLPAYPTADTWQRVFCKFATPASLTAIISMGLQQVTDLADGTFDIDDVRAVKEIAGAKDWSITYNANIVEVTDYADAGVQANIVGGTNWSGSFDTFKDGDSDLTIGSEVAMTFAESDTVGQYFAGNVILNSVSPSAPLDGAVSYAYGFTGTGDLEVASA